MECALAELAQLVAAPADPVAALGAADPVRAESGEAIGRQRADSPLGLDAGSLAVAGLGADAFIVRILSVGHRGADPLASGQIAGLAGRGAAGIAAEPVDAGAGQAFGADAAGQTIGQDAGGALRAELGARTFGLGIGAGLDGRAAPLQILLGAVEAEAVAEVLAAAAVDAEPGETVGCGVADLPLNLQAAQRAGASLARGAIALGIAALVGRRAAPDQARAIAALASLVADQVAADRVGAEAGEAVASVAAARALELRAKARAVAEIASAAFGVRILADGHRLAASFGPEERAALTVAGAGRGAAHFIHTEATAAFSVEAAGLAQGLHAAALAIADLGARAFVVGIGAQAYLGTYPLGPAQRAALAESRAIRGAAGSVDAEAGEAVAGQKT